MPPASGNIRVKTFALACFLAISWGLPLNASPGKSEKFTLALGQSKTVKALKVELIAVLEDNRCPKDVLCVWAGIAVVQVNVTKDGKTRDAYLGMLGNRGAPQVMGKEFDPQKPKETFWKFEPGRLDLGDVQLEIEQVEPERETTKQVAPGDYRISLLLSPK